MTDALAEFPTGLEWQTLVTQVGRLWRKHRCDTVQLASILHRPEHVVYSALAHYREEVRNGLH